MRDAAQLWGEIEALGIGFLQLAPSVFYEMTYHELTIACDWKRKDIEQRGQLQWETARFIVHRLLQPHLKKSARLKPQDIARFTWEEKPKPTVVTAADRERLIKLAQQESQRLKNAKKVRHEPVR
jgi:hypothetical protein